MEKLGKLYTLSEAADLFRVHRKTIARIVESGDLAVVRIGQRGVRLRESALRAYQSREPSRRRPTTKRRTRR